MFEWFLRLALSISCSVVGFLSSPIEHIPTENAFTLPSISTRNYHKTKTASFPKMSTNVNSESQTFVATQTMSSDEANSNVSLNMSATDSAIKEDFSNMKLMTEINPQNKVTKSSSFPRTVDSVIDKDLSTPFKISMSFSTLAARNTDNALHETNSTESTSAEVYTATKLATKCTECLTQPPIVHRTKATTESVSDLSSSTTKCVNCQNKDDTFISRVIDWFVYKVCNGSEYDGSELLRLSVQLEWLFLKGTKKNHRKRSQMSNASLDEFTQRMKTLLTCRSSKKHSNTRVESVSARSKRLSAFRKVTIGLMAAGVLSVLFVLGYFVYKLYHKINPKPPTRPSAPTEISTISTGTLDKGDREYHTSKNNVVFTSC